MTTAALDTSTASALQLGLPASAYTDPAIYARERDTILARTWQYVCHVELVRDPGDYMVTEVAGESLIVVRGEDRQLRAFYNVCAHRGARVAAGRGCRKRLTCPYHGWTYDTAGQLIGAPNARKVAGFKLGDYRLKSCRVEQIHGLVFVNFDPDVRPLGTLLSGLEDQLKAFSPDLPDLTFAHRTEADMACNWKVAVENYSECYHCALVHKAFFGANGVDGKSYRIGLKG